MKNEADENRCPGTGRQGMAAACAPRQSQMDIDLILTHVLFSPLCVAEGLGESAGATLKMPQAPNPLMKPFVVLALPGMYLFYKYNQYKRKRKENAKRRLTERELQHLNNKIVSQCKHQKQTKKTCVFFYYGQ